MRLTIRTISVLLLATSIASSLHAEEARLTVLHTTDLHGALTAFDYPSDRPANRGLVKLATLIAVVRRESAPVLLLDCGDVMDGGIEAALPEASRSPDPMVAAMNQLHYDAMAPGNHEFDRGPVPLEKAHAASRFPWLAANVVRGKDGKPLFTPSIVRTMGPLRVGIIGLVTPAVPRFLDAPRLAGIKFLDPVASARREVDRLRTKERCDAVVVVAHTGLEHDPATGAPRRGDTPDENWGERIARDVPGIDLLVLGHTHVVIPSTTVSGVLVTQAGKWGEGLGRVDLVFQRDGPEAPWRVSGRRADVIAVTDSTAPDSALAAFAKPWHDTARAALAETVGTAARRVDSPGGRLANGPAWDLIHRAQLAATGAQVSLASLPDPTASIGPGPVTRRDLLRLYPTSNALEVVKLRGADLRAALEQSARWFTGYRFEASPSIVDAAWPAYNFDSASGVEYSIDLTRPAGSRITRLDYRGAPVTPDMSLTVAVNSYRRNGGGGFESVRTAPAAASRPAAGSVREALAAYVRKHGPLDGAFAANWSVAPDAAVSPERPLIELLVRHGAIPAAWISATRVAAPANPAEIEGWIARAFGFAPAPPADTASLAAWTAAARAALGSTPAFAKLDGSRTPGVAEVQALCLAAARSKGWALADSSDAMAFRRSLLTAVSPPTDSGVTRAQALGMIANARYPSIRILETTDFHGAILPGATERRTNRPIGSSPVLAAWIERLRAENPEGTALIDGGDLFQGTMISNFQFGRPVVEQMNALGYAAAAIGNHEFDWTADTLVRRIREMHFSALGANMRERKSGRLPDWARSDTMFVRRGARVSVLGLCYRYTPSVTLAANVAQLEFLDDSTTAAQIVPKLRARSDVVVEVGHIPAESDTGRHAESGDLPRLAQIPGVDAWFGGHSHNQVLDWVQGIPIAIAGAQGQTIAVCDLVVDPLEHRVIERLARLVDVRADEIAPDTAMARRVERWNATVGPIASQPLGTCAHTLTRNRGGESTLGDFVTDAIRAAAQVDIAFQNSGGLRADLPEGTVTRGTVFAVMPFDNRVYTLELTGAEVRRALEQGLRNSRVTQASGIRYVYDSAAPSMQRVVSVTLADGKPLDDARIYRVACNDFMATGGDNYDVLSGGRKRTLTDLLVRDTLERLVTSLSKAGRAVDYAPDGRITRK